MVNVCKCRDCRCPLRVDDYRLVWDYVTKRNIEFCIRCYEACKAVNNYRLDYPRGDDYDEKVNWTEGGF